MQIVENDQDSWLNDCNYADPKDESCRFITVIKLIMQIPKNTVPNFTITSNESLKLNLSPRKVSWTPDRITLKSGFDVIQVQEGFPNH